MQLELHSKPGSGSHLVSLVDSFRSLFRNYVELLQHARDYSRVWKQDERYGLEWYGSIITHGHVIDRKTLILESNKEVWSDILVVPDPRYETLGRSFSLSELQFSHLKTIC